MSEVRTIPWESISDWFAKNEQQIRDVMKFEGLRGAVNEILRIAPDQPELDAQRLRADTAEAERDEQKRLRASSEGSNAAWRMTVGLAEAMLENPAYELSGIDWDYEHSIHDKVRAKNAELIAAEQRIASMTSVLHLFASCADVRQVGTAAMDYVAALNPKPEVGSK